jgi:hypothetical protein
MELGAAAVCGLVACVYVSPFFGDPMVGWECMERGDQRKPIGAHCGFARHHQSG